ncbi:DUF3800 domain-containing protein [Streptomyces sp. UNOC14_S4]|uniref:DUF3800 domain-containing protein n=1 Tax=Streptomyces sp. UNOC14_S4 TaxID=2872340 RepID=UPI001E49A14C|nr:DUF3800 domain-containing protein [Streptomyces sp. UNOC14_S4]MCC3769891.1 DUF3800 domain-containing protein [Streptomyces sp. UNOC14_S4]
MAALAAEQGTFRVVYVDDSGNARDVAALGWLDVDARTWNVAMEDWKRFRVQLYEDEKTQIPVDYEFHAVNFVPGRGNPSVLESWNRQKRHRGPVALKALDVIARMPGVRTGAVYRRTKDYARDRVDLYRAWLHRLNEELVATDSHAVVIVDGDGTEHAYRRVHRELAGVARRIVEDSVFQPARENHFLQCADLVAYTAFQSVIRAPGKQFMWDWYRSRLPLAQEPAEL